MHLELALFGEDPRGVRLIGRLSDPDLVELARERIAGRKRLELAGLEGSGGAGSFLRVVPEAPEETED